MSNHGYKPADDLVERAFDAIRNAPVPEVPPARVVASTIEALTASETSPDTVRIQRRRETMFRIARYGGFAAALSAAVVVAVWLFATDGGVGVAFGDVVKNVERATSVTFRNKQKIGRQPEMELQWYLHRQRARVEMTGVMAFVVDMEAKKAVRLDPARNKAMRIDLDERAAAEFTNPIEQLRNAKPGEAQRIGEETLDGVKTVVYRIERVALFGIKGKAVMNVWIDPAVGLPAKIEIRDPDSKVSLGFDRFVWNEPLSPELFDLDVPEGYTLDDGLGGPPPAIK